MQSLVRILTILLISVIPSLPANAEAKWRAVNMGWSVSCGVDRGAIQKSGKTYVFRTSANHCPGGIFNQRAEISSKNISVRAKETYLFETIVSFRSSSQEPFGVFQIADGRRGCSPPLTIRWEGSGKLRLFSDYTRGQGMAGCVENRRLRDARYVGPRLRRDGTQYKMQIRLQFDGTGSFDLVVAVNGTNAIAGRYEPSADPNFVASSHFNMKHGVYSQYVWPYEMTSEGMRVLKATQ